MRRSGPNIRMINHRGGLYERVGCMREGGRRQCVVAGLMPGNGREGPMADLSCPPEARIQRKEFRGYNASPVFLTMTLCSLPFLFTPCCWSCLGMDARTNCRPVLSPQGSYSKEGILDTMRHQPFSQRPSTFSFALNTLRVSILLAAGLMPGNEGPIADLSCPPKACIQRKEGRIRPKGRKEE